MSEIVNCPACRLRVRDLIRHLRFAHQEKTVLWIGAPQR